MVIKSPAQETCRYPPFGNEMYGITLSPAVSLYSYRATECEQSIVIHFPGTSGSEFLKGITFKLTELII